MKNKLPIGVFDSGVGGLSVLRSIRDLLPYESFVYLADNKRIPYGPLPKELIQKHVLNALKFFKNYPVKMVVLGCHTASTACLYDPEFVSQIRLLEIPVIGIVDSSLHSLKELLFEKIAILGTKGTIQSEIYQKSLSKLFPHAEIFPVVCSTLASLVEEGRSECEITDALKKYLHAVSDRNIDVVLLACTHYSFVHSLVEGVLGKRASVLDPAKELALQVKALTPFSESQIPGECKIFVTKLDAAFERKLNHFSKGPVFISLAQID